MYSSIFYTLSAEAQDKIVAYNSLTDEQRESRREDALQCQMEDSWDDILEDDEWDEEEDDYADSGDWGYTEEDALRDDMSDLRIAIRAHARKLDILDAQVRALKGDTCTGLVLYDPAYYITEFEGAVFYAGHKF